MCIYKRLQLIKYYNFKTRVVLLSDIRRKPAHAAYKSATGDVRAQLRLTPLSIDTPRMLS